ncbi:hypothetical protein KEM55_004410 [Ascosphaera atra]|nr:hypothetical protein KEM55_004410 [Ascosphaera atra]
MVGPALPCERCSKGVRQDALEAAVHPSTPSAVEITPAECLPPPPDIVVAQCHERLEAKKAKRVAAAVTAGSAAVPPVALPVDPLVKRCSLSPAGRPPTSVLLPVEEKLSDFRFSCTSRAELLNGVPESRLAYKAHVGRDGPVTGRVLPVSAPAVRDVVKAM